MVGVDGPRTFLKYKCSRLAETDSKFHSEAIFTPFKDQENQDGNRTSMLIIRKAISC